MSLLREDLQTKTWERMEALLHERLREHRERNDGSLDAEATAKLRGRIAEVKELLALATPPDPAPRGDS